MEPRWLPAPVFALIPPAAVRPAALTATTTTITSPTNPSAYNQSVTFTINVSAPTGSTVAPIGTLTIMDGTTVLNNPAGPVTLSPVAGTATSTASFTIYPRIQPPSASGSAPAFTGAGANPITATYSGDATYSASTSTPVVQVVQPVQSVVAVTLSANAVPVNQPVTITATVAPPFPTNSEVGPAPTGSVTLLDNGKAVGTEPLTAAAQPAAGGIASGVSVTATNLTAGSHVITVSYPGDANYAAATSAPQTLLVQAATTTTVAIAPNPVALGQSAIVGVTVKGPAGGATPTGLITYVASSNTKNGGVNSGVILSGFAPLDASGRAVIGLLPPTTGSYSVTVNYLGDANFFTSFSTVETLRVLLPTTTFLASSQTRSTAGRPVTFTAIVAGITGGTPTGTVTFRDGSKVLGTAPLSTAGRATLTTAALATGTHAITAIYNGSAQFAASPPGAVTQVVSPVTPVVPTGDGPRIVGVRRLGIHFQPTTIVLTFNGPLNFFTAQNVANYALSGPSPSTKSIRITSAVYNATAHTVTLHPAMRLDAHPRFRYTLLVNGSAAGGVTGATGRLLDGANLGHPGSDFVTIIAGL